MKITPTKRERDRLQQHLQPGHALVEGIPNMSNVVGGVHYTIGAARLYTCSCGWLGWMRAGLLT
jgi:hypothetical protein